MNYQELIAKWAHTATWMWDNDINPMPHLRAECSEELPHWSEVHQDCCEYVAADRSKAEARAMRLAAKYVAIRPPKDGEQSFWQVETASGRQWVTAVNREAATDILTAAGLSWCDKHGQLHEYAPGGEHF